MKLDCRASIITAIKLLAGVIYFYLRYCKVADGSNQIALKFMILCMTNPSIIPHLPEAKSADSAQPFAAYHKGCLLYDDGNHITHQSFKEDWNDGLHTEELTVELNSKCRKEYNNHS